MNLRTTVLTFFLIIGASTYNYSQEESNIPYKPLSMIHVLSFSGEANFGVAKAAMSNSGTDWKHPFGYHVGTGVGVSYLIKNSWGIEADFAYQINKYMYANKTINLNLGYTLPAVDLKVKKMFRKEEKTSYFLRFGVGYLFGGIASKSEIKDFYSYQMNLVSRSSILLIPEFGIQKRLNKTSYINMSVIYQHGTNAIFTNSMNYWDDINGPIETASSSTRGNYIGVNVKYYYIFKEFSKKVDSGRKAPDKRF